MSSRTNGGVGMISYNTRYTCRVCGGKDLTPLFSLGEQAVSDFVDKENIHNGIKAPIDIELCNTCTLVQNRHTAPQELLYKRNYWYKSGVTQTMRDALRDITAAAERLVGLRPGDVVLDIGSNDGTLLRSYTKTGMVRVGVEPALNLMEEGSKGIDLLIGDFWSYEEYLRSCNRREFGARPAKVVTAIGMMYDMDDPNPFVADIAEVLADDGIFIAQLMCLRNMVDLGDVGNFAHEHLEFYSLKSLKYLYEKNGLYIIGIEKNTVNGQSYRIYAKKIVGEALYCPVLENLIEEEEKLGLYRSEFYKQFYQKMVENRDKVVTFIKQAVSEGKKVWVYGSSTKGNVILQFYQLDDTLITAAAERSPAKLGKYTIATGIPIYGEEEFRAAKPEYALMLPYSFRREMLHREEDWLIGGGKFIIPLPVPMVARAGEEIVCYKPL